MWAGDERGQQKVSKQRKMDRQRKGYCCLSIHLRCTWKSSTMTAHPSATGVLLSLLEQNQNPSLSIMHHFSSLLSSSASYFSLHVLQNAFFCVVFVSCLSHCSSAEKWPTLSFNVKWRTKKTGYKDNRGPATK